MSRSSPPKLDSNTQLYGIIGDPIGHSLSPKLHNAVFEKFGMNAVYLAFRVEASRVEQAFDAMRALGIAGFNVTVPHKEAAIDCIDEIPHDIDRVIGAINTIVNRDGRLFGYNTDSPGFLSSLKQELAFNPKGKKVLLLGAGGAARGVSFSLALAGAEKMWVYNRTREKGVGLADLLTKHFPKTEFSAIGGSGEAAMEKIDLVVNTTSVGMEGNPGVPLDLRHLKSQPAVVDLVYSPEETEFLKQARRLDLRCTNGLGMLVAQAALSFERWTGKTEGVQALMADVLKKCL